MRSFLIYQVRNNKLQSIIFVLLVFCYSSKNLNAQTVFYQDIFKGGICIAGTSTGNGIGQTTLPIFINSNATVKKVFLVAYAIEGSNYAVNDYTFSLNSISFTFSKSMDWTLFNPNNLGPTSYIGSRIHVKDITDDLPIIGNSITFDWQNIQSPPSNCPSCIYGAPLIVILYEDFNLPNVNFSLIINNKANDLESILTFENLNLVDFGQDIGLGVHCDRLGGGINDGYIFEINNNYVGKLDQQDISSIYSGAVGNYYYENSTLFGLTDDIANDSLNGSDGVLRLNNYASGTLDNTEFKFNYIIPDALAHNFLIGTYLSHATPCDTFTVSVPSVLNICKGDTATIQATGGNNYEWTPQIGLSCYNCPNPIVTADSNMYYSLRVWNTDSCSKVLPIRINVLDLPTISNITTWDTPCTDSIGHFLVEDNVYPYASYTLNDTLTQPYNHFYFLPPGEHELVVSDTNNCKVDTVIIINSYNDVVASFTANPMLGEIPFEVNFTNTSSAATNYIWYVENDTLTTTNINHTFTQEGSFDVTLVAIDQYPACSDTASVRIIAETPFSIFAPTIVNQSNGNYSITISGTSKLEYNLFDDLGQLLFHQNYATTTDGLLTLWTLTLCTLTV